MTHSSLFPRQSKRSILKTAASFIPFIPYITQNTITATMPTFNSTMFTFTITSQLVSAAAILELASTTSTSITHPQLASSTPSPSMRPDSPPSWSTPVVIGVTLAVIAILTGLPGAIVALKKLRR
ncbi:hypothetical protein BKA63DRAFT_57587 [Paraphoma chrysanthemicola]|nr:hypothetical protein BKA63DRAFT_57587 [Paraphoma chrysanthemicola]